MESMKYKWTERAICDYYHEQETGKIVATLSRQSISDDVWYAEVNGDRLGQYITNAQAKKAIENKIKEVDDDYARLRETMPKGLIDPKSYYAGYDDGVEAQK